MKISRFSVQHPVIIGMILLALAVFGFVSIYDVNIEFMSDINIPQVYVISIYPGASSQDIEETVIDVMEDNVHLGGYIMPGISSYKDFYKDISKVLDVSLDLSVNLHILPSSTKEAVSFGILKSILLMLKHTSSSKKIYFTGGDGKFFAKFFDNSIFDNTLVFKGMQKALKEMEKKPDVQTK